MFENNVLTHNNLLQYAQEGASFACVVPLLDLPRVQALLGEQAATIQVTMQFSQDAMQRCVMQGTLAGVVNMTCQRCLQPMQQVLQTEFTLYPVADEAQALQLADVADAVVMQANTLVLRDVIEDELILSMPMIATHAANECSAVLNQRLQQLEVDDKPQQEEKLAQNPFRVLAETVS